MNLIQYTKTDYEYYILSLEELQLAEKQYLDAIKRWSDSDNIYGRPKDSELKFEWLKYEANELGFKLYGFEDVEGTLILDKKYVITTNGKWRILGKNTWYCYNCSTREKIKEFLLKYFINPKKHYTEVYKSKKN